MKKEINILKSLIYLSCELMNILPPLIYFVDYTNAIRLYDKHLNIISYDYRDIGFHVYNVLLIPKENTVYINLSILKDMKKAYILIIRETRRLYQLEEISRYSHNIATHENKELLQSWLHSYRIYNTNKTYNIIAPPELDCNVYSTYLMKTIFHIRLNFEVKFDKKEETRKFNERYLYISMIYNQNKILELANKYKLL